MPGCCCDCSTGKEGASWLFLTVKAAPHQPTHSRSSGAPPEPWPPVLPCLQQTSLQSWGHLVPLAFARGRVSESQPWWEFTHVPMASSPPGWAALWLSPMLVLVAALSMGPGMTGTLGLMETTPIWESQFLPCSRLTAPLSFYPFADSAVILWPLCPMK